MTTLLSTGKKELDTYLNGGYKKQSLSLVLARPGMGLTRWLLESSFESSNHRHALFITLQTSIQDTIEYLMHIYDGKVIQKHPDTIHLAEASRATVVTLDELISFNKKENDIEMVFIDAIHELKGEFSSSDLCELAKKYDVAIIAGSQMERFKDERTDKRPTLKDVQIEMEDEEITYLITLHREELYDADTSEANMLEVHLLKGENLQQSVLYKETFDKNRIC